MKEEEKVSEERRQRSPVYTTERKLTPEKVSLLLRSEEGTVLWTKWGDEREAFQAEGPACTVTLSILAELEGDKVNQKWEGAADECAEKGTGQPAHSHAGELAFVLRATGNQRRVLRGKGDSGKVTRFVFEKIPVPHGSRERMRAVQSGHRKMHRGLWGQFRWEMLKTWARMLVEEPVRNRQIEYILDSEMSEAA